MERGAERERERGRERDVHNIIHTYTYMNKHVHTYRCIPSIHTLKMLCRLSEEKFLLSVMMRSDVTADRAPSSSTVDSSTVCGPTHTEQYMQSHIEL